MTCFSHQVEKEGYLRKLPTGLLFSEQMFPYVICNAVLFFTLFCKSFLSLPPIFNLPEASVGL